MQSYDSIMQYDSKGQHVRLSAEQIKRCRAAFALYDEDGSGAISADELTKCFEHMGHHLSKKEVADLFKRGGRRRRSRPL